MTAENSKKMEATNFRRSWLIRIVGDDRDSHTTALKIINDHGGDDGYESSDLEEKIEYAENASRLISTMSPEVIDLFFHAELDRHGEYREEWLAKQVIDTTKTIASDPWRDGLHIVEAEKIVVFGSIRKFTDRVLGYALANPSSFSVRLLEDNDGTKIAIEIL